MLTDKEVNSTCIYWANRYRSKKFHFDELYNVGYLIAKKQTTVLTLQKSVRGALLRFMINSQKFTAQCRSLENDNLNSGEENDLALCDKDNSLMSIIESEELLAIIKESKISQSLEFLEILRFRFVENLTLTQIAEKYNVSKQTISQRYNIILDRLINVNRKRQSCRK